MNLFEADLPFLCIRKIYAHRLICVFYQIHLDSIFNLIYLNFSSPCSCLKQNSHFCLRITLCRLLKFCDTFLYVFGFFARLIQIFLQRIITKKTQRSSNILSFYTAILPELSQTIYQNVDLFSQCTQYDAIILWLFDCRTEVFIENE